MTAQFDHHGELLAPLPPDCIREASRGRALEYWADHLRFTDALADVEELARAYCASFERWPDCHSVPLETIAERVLYLAAQESADAGSWYGLVI